MTRMNNSVMAVMLWVFLSAQGCTAFSTPSLHRQSATTVTVGNRLPCTTLSATSSDDETSRSLTSRRKWTRNILSSVIAYGAAATILGLPKPESAHAASDGEATIYKTGKAPIIPGQKPKDKGDTKGTKKDPSFLRSVSDCKGKCENSYGPDGLARSSAECLSSCQDICCTTYEQCTFAIVPR
eukprot:g9298.t1 g9298   contig36:292385-293015(+)